MIERTSPRVQLIAGLLLLASGACTADGPDGADETGATVRDSAGVTIVEHTSPPPGPSDPFRISDTPSVSLGAADGPEHELFSAIRGVLSLSDGSIVVADGASNELRYFDPTGAFVVAVGGTGEGPGELQQLSAIVGAPGDTVWIHDLFASRVTRFDSEGALVGSIPLTQWSEFSPIMAPLGFGPGDSVVIRGVAGPPQPGFGPGAVDAPVFLADLRAGEGRMRSFGEVPFALAATEADGNPLPVLPMVVPVQVPTSGGVWTGVPTEPELRLLSWSGEPKTLVRFAEGPEPLAEADVEAIRSWYRDQSGGGANSPDPAVLHQALRFARVLVDAADHLWIQEALERQDPEEWVFGAPRGSHRWRVLDPEGIWLATVDFPEGFEPHFVADDHVLGIWTDGDGVEHVHRYDLMRGEGGTRGEEQY